MPARPSSARRLASLRLAAQRLSSPAPDVVTAVRSLLALQAQDFPGVCWSLGLRAASATEASVLAALTAGSIVRSWPMRGTLHLVAAEDLGWILSLTADRTLRAAATRRAALALDDRALDLARQIAHDALADRQIRSREQMMEHFEQGGLSTDGQRGYHLLWHLAHSGLICFGPPDGKTQTFARLDTWIPQPRRLEREPALAELARRYFTSHGPATLRDFSWWSSLTMKDVRLGVAAAGDALTSIELDDTSYLLAPELLDAPLDDPPALALPGFDELLLGYQDRSAVLPAAFAPRIVPGANGMFLPTMLIDGRVVGTWKRTHRARHVALQASPFEPLSRAAQRSFTEAAGHYGEFLARPVEVSFDDPT